MRLRRLGTWAWLAAFIATPALSHPHVLCDVTLRFVIDESGKLVGLAESWTFDEGYSQFATQGLDSKHDGKPTTGDLQSLVDENMAELDPLHDFTAITSDGKALGTKEAERAMGIFDKGRLTISFNAMLMEPVDPKLAPVLVKVYDPSYFTDMRFAAAALKDNASLPKNCAVGIDDVAPSEDLEQTRQMLAGHAVGWQPVAPTDFGVMFAKTVSLACH